MSILISSLLLLIATHQSVCQLNSAQKQLLLDLHNQARSEVSPTAANMERMEWNDELAQVAQTYSERCMFAHNPSRASQAPSFSSVGENLAISSGLSDNYEALFVLWNDEHAEYNFTTNVCSGVCGHYTQIVWATSNQLGCGATRCPTVIGFSAPNALLLVCDYGPAGNFIGRQPYTAGASCSACPGSKPSCSNNLCSNVMTDPTSTISTASAASTSSTSVGPNPTASTTPPTSTTSTTPPTSTTSTNSITPPTSPTTPTKPPKIIISSSPSPPRVTVGSHLSLYCIAVEGMPVPQVQWYSDGLPVYPSPQMYQQIYVVPTDSPHTTTYTCVGTTHSEGVITNELKVNITVTVEKSCPRLRAPRNGDVTITNDQQLAVFSCDRFYTMRGSHVLKCKKGKWNASPPTCHSISKFCRRKCDF